MTPLLCVIAFDIVWEASCSNDSLCIGVPDGTLSSACVGETAASLGSAGLGCSEAS